MDYYIRPEQTETDFLRISRPEDLKICDPACGSGHMLVYAFDLLYAIYEEEGCEPADIPEKIFRHNLYGMEIDPRAGELAAFALTMKARARHRRFFSKKVAPHICVLENIHFDDDEIQNYMDFVGRDLFTVPLLTTLRQFEEADNFGSLIRPDLTDIEGVLSILNDRNVFGQIFLRNTHQKVQKVLRQADYLRPKYHVVIANPPYMGRKGMNERLGFWAKDNYPNSKSDLYAIFVERIIEFIRKGGFIGLMTPFTWMFLSSYENLRNRIFQENTLTTLIRPEYHAFFESAFVPICGFTFYSKKIADFKGSFIDLQSFYGADAQSYKALEAINNKQCGWFYRASAADFKKIPGSPIAYWVSQSIIRSFQADRVEKWTISEGQNKTANNDKYVRNLWEISKHSCGRGKKWLPYAKGGDFRKWYGNKENLIDWSEPARTHYRKDSNCRIIAEYLWYRKGITWTLLTSSHQSFRLLDENETFDMTGSSVFVKDDFSLDYLLAFLNSKVSAVLNKSLNPTLALQIKNVRDLPIIVSNNKTIFALAKSVVSIEKVDWNSYETAWDFTKLPLLHPDYRRLNLKASYTQLRTHWNEMTLKMQRLEEENNRIFIEAYGLQDELTPDVPLKEITLTCNPHYRYGVDACEAESEARLAMEARLLEDTMKEFISYSIGCMFERYSLDMPGLVLANQGETVEDYNRKIEAWKNRNSDHSSFPSGISFPPGRSNVIPILDSNWFADDVVENFQRFLRVTFGDDSYEDNLRFMENALGKDIRRYFLKDFYSDHLRRYKKRPIYWLFSSPKGSFSALIYMHRYRPDTASVILNDYLREFSTKLISRKTHLEAVSIRSGSSTGQKTQALKEIERLKKIISELDDYEREVLYPLATRQVEIDLDDGVKVNYMKFGSALRKIPGLDANEQ